MQRLLTLIAVLTLTAACNGDATAWRDMPSYWETVEANKPKKPKPPTPEEMLDGRELTICADEVAVEIDPDLPAIIAESVGYWHDEGYTNIVAGAGTKCDIAVVFRGENVNWPEGAAASAGIPPKKLGVYIREALWAEMTKNGFRTVIVTHEIGHIHTGPDHTETGIMSPDGELCEMLEEKLGRKHSCSSEKQEQQEGSEQ